MTGSRELIMMPPATPYTRRVMTLNSGVVVSKYVLASSTPQRIVAAFSAAGPIAYPAVVVPGQRSEDGERH